MSISNMPKKDFFYTFPAADPYCLGHIRLDFGKDDEHWTKFFEHSCTEQLMTEELRKEANLEVRRLYDTSFLRSFGKMQAYCRMHSKAAIGTLYDGRTKEYGFRTETEHLVYYIRCRPIKGDYQAYIYIYIKKFEEHCDG